MHLKGTSNGPDLHVLKGGMKTSDGSKRIGHFMGNPTSAAMERMELYCAAHPGSPSAARRPELLFRGQLWIAVLGPNVEEGIVGIGKTVEAALCAFDTRYLACLRPPPDGFRRGIYHSRVRAA